jgi:SPP1 gp7 family putative phage head morphogenesis protein
MVFGVTKTQVSKYEDVNYATALSQDKVFISNTCIPMMRQIESEVNSQWLEKIGYSIAFDERSNEAMTYLAADEATKVVNLSGSGIITINEAREMIGLDPVPWGDEIPSANTADILPPSPMPVGRATEPEDDEDEDDEEVAKDIAEKAAFEEAFAKARRTNTWHALNNLITPIEKRCARAVRKYFFDAERKVLAQVGKSLAGAIDKIADPDIESAFSDEKLYYILRQYLGQSIIAGSQTIGGQVNIEDPGIAQYLADRVKYMKGVNDNAKEGLKEKLHKVLQDAMENKLTEEQRTTAIQQMLKEGFGELKSHARSIARTEVHGAFSEGRFEACKETEPSEIEWVSSRDPLVRDSHARLDGKRVKFGEEFSNGCKYPLDPAGGPAEVINCRCNFQTHY